MPGSPYTLRMRSTWSPNHLYETNTTLGTEQVAVAVMAAQMAAFGAVSMVGVRVGVMAGEVMVVEARVSAVKAVGWEVGWEVEGTAVEGKEAVVMVKVVRAVARVGGAMEVLVRALVRQVGETAESWGGRGW